MVYIGIDPGLNGGIAVVNESGTQYQAWTYTDVRLRDVLEEYKGKCKAIVEKVGARPGQGVSSMFTFGRCYGYILGCIEANGIPYQLVTPQRWKREFGATSDKKTSIEVCQRLFPEIDLRRSQRATKPHDGKAEALLIAEYARRHM